MNWFTLWMIVINTSFWLVCCFGVAYLVRLIPESLYIKNQWFFKEHPFEKKLYKILRLNKWKDRLPEWGKVWHFEKKNLDKELSLKYVDQFILETKYSEIGHLGMAVAGFACVLVNPGDYVVMAFSCSIINLFIQMPFCLIQRYNRPRLLRLKLRLEYQNQKSSDTSRDLNRPVYKV